MCDPGGAAAHRRGQVSATPAAQPPLAPPMGELASEARLRGCLQGKIRENAEIVAGYPLSRIHTPAIEPGDPQRCWSTARVAGSS